MVTTLGGRKTTDIIIIIWTIWGLLRQLIEEVIVCQRRLSCLNILLVISDKLEHTVKGSIVYRQGSENSRWRFRNNLPCGIGGLHLADGENIGAWTPLWKYNFLSRTEKNRLIEKEGERGEMRERDRKKKERER